MIKRILLEELYLLRQENVVKEIRSRCGWEGKNTCSRFRNSYEYIIYRSLWSRWFDMKSGWKNTSIVLILYADNRH